MSKGYGRIISIQGQIAEVEFSHGEASIHDILISEDDSHVKLQVSVSSDRSSFFCLSLSPTSNLYRGMKVVNTRKTIMVPVGDKILGRVIDVFGRPLDGKGEIKADQTLPIYRKALSFDDCLQRKEILELSLIHI